jgi:hypothetical protein
MITGSRLAVPFTDAGIEHVPLRGAAGIDDRDIDATLPERKSKRGLLRYDIDSSFIATMPPAAGDSAGAARASAAGCRAV